MQRYSYRKVRNSYVVVLIKDQTWVRWFHHEDDAAKWAQDLNGDQTMNTVASSTISKVEDENPARSFGKYFTNAIISDDIGMHFSNVYVQIIEAGQKGFMVHLSKDDAIDAAKTILTYYGVPFCNRVS